MAFPGVPGMEQIEHLVILMMENRSFDHYLGALKIDPGYPYRDDVEGLADGAVSNLDENDQPVFRRLMNDRPCNYPDLPHGPGPQRANYNEGALDGFVKSYQADLRKLPPQYTDAQVADLGPLAMGYYNRDVLSVLYSLADNFTVCDHWFSSMLSSTWPNRKYLHSGVRDADDDTQSLPPFPGFKTKLLWDWLEDSRDSYGNKHTWKCYYSDLPFLAFWYEFAAFHAFNNFTRIENFVVDCREDKLPTVSIIDPAFSLADDHPTHDVRLGQKFIGLIVDALTHSESWAKTALVITYDENGGFYDHVRPPAAFDAGAVDTPMGFRVPTIVVSPFAKKGVCKTVFDHTSIMKSISVRWGVDFGDARYGERWKQAPDIWSTCFDFTQAPRPMETYTQPAADVGVKDDPMKNVTWESGIHQLMTSPIGDLEALLERMFLLPELKSLDGRNGVFNSLNNMETSVVNLKRMVRSAASP